MQRQQKISRKSAKDAGLRHYFTGCPCARGHIGLRLVSTFQCLSCLREIAKEKRRKVSVNSPKPIRRTKEQIKEAMRAYRLANKKTIADRKKKYCEEHADSIRAKRRQRYLLNAEIARAKTAEYRRANPERVKAACNAWRKANPDARRAQNYRRKARVRGASGTHTAADISRIKTLQRNRCGYCRKKLGSDYHVDHIVALSNGGSNRPGNLQVLCPPCNMRKHNKDPLTFARELGRLV